MVKRQGQETLGTLACTPLMCSTCNTALSSAVALPTVDVHKQTLSDPMLEELSDLAFQI